MEVLTLGPDLIEPLSRMLCDLEAAGDAEGFRPHAFTPDALRMIIDEAERDRYYVVVEDEVVVAYGMLRGWDEGYDTPSVGLAVSPSTRGRGIGRFLIQFLHLEAKREGATRVRLTVNDDNEPALRLYRSMGYAFERFGDHRLVGYASL